MRLVYLLVLGCVAWSQVEWREAELNGRKIRYRVIDGEAVWQGDILLGPVEEVGKGTRASAVIIGQRSRWPDNTIPYVIDDDVPDRARVEGAIQHWNTKTPMRLVPRQGEASYIEFRRRNGFSCSSNVGMVGGRQYINLPDDCGQGSVIHEIGHAVGLYHTQSREDRDLYVRVHEDSIARDSLDQWAVQSVNADDIGPYPYDSIMHYSTTGFAYGGEVAAETIPLGIPLGQRDGLAASDIDTVVRIYGGQPRRTVITSNPPGMDVIVDGRTVKTPADFDWAIGSQHTVNVNDGTLNGAIVRFARWSDFGPRSHTITASGETTVFTAHMTRLLRLPLAASPANGGVVALTAAGLDGFFVPDGGLLTLAARPSSGFVFTNWSGFGFFSAHGSGNPIRFAMTSPDLTYTASFTNSPVTTITSSPPGLRVVVDNVAYTTPRRFVWPASSRHDISVDSTSQTTRAGGASHSFARWTDNGEPRHTVTAAAEGGTVTAVFNTQYRVTTTPSLGGRIVVEPSAASGYLPGGTTIRVTAIANQGFQFAGWGGNAPGGGSQKNIEISGELDLEAAFAPTRTLTQSSVVNAAGYTGGPVAPGEIVTIFGVGLGPDEIAGLTLTPQGSVATTAGGVRVTFDSTAAPVIYASSTQVAVVTPFNVAGKSSVRVQLDYNGQATNAIVIPVAAAAPAFFAANASGRGGGAFLNEDGSLNSASNAAARGSVVSLYATGLGMMSPPMQDGALAGDPLPRIAGSFKVRIAERECEVLYAGAAPGLVAGLVQINVRVPEDIAPGVLPVMLEAAGVLSPRTVGVAVR